MNLKYTKILQWKIMNIPKYTHKWKSPGIDKITNFWLRHVFFTHQLMTKFISEIIKEPEKFLNDSQKEQNTYCQKQMKQ